MAAPKAKPAAAVKGKVKTRKKEKKNVAVGQAHIKSTFNNTIISITDPTGAVISWSSATTSDTSNVRDSFTKAVPQ